MPPVSHPSGPFSSFLMAILVKSPFKVGALFILWTPEESECISWAEHSIRNKIDAPGTLNTSPSFTLSWIVLWHFWMPNRNASFSGAKTYISIWMIIVSKFLDFSFFLHRYENKNNISGGAACLLAYLYLYLFYAC